MRRLKAQWNRRQLLKVASINLGVAALAGCSSSTKQTGPDDRSESPMRPLSPNPAMAPAGKDKSESTKATRVNKVTDTNPINRTYGDMAPFRYGGGAPDHIHQQLWDTNGALNSSSNSNGAPPEKAALVIVGGGLSGLVSAYRLRSMKPIVLEAGARFGGNAQGESWRGIDYSIGASRMHAPHPNSPQDRDLKELGIYESARELKNWGSVLYNKKLFNDFFHGETDPALIKQISVLEKYFSEKAKNRFSPEAMTFAPTTEEQKKSFRDLDQKSFQDHIKSIVGVTKLHPHLETWLEYYCWTTFAGSSLDLSAAVGEYRLTADFGKVISLPGGNAFLAEKVLKSLKKSIGEERLRAQCVALQIKVVPDGVMVTYEERGELKSILADSVILACPQMVVRKILQNLEPEREKIIRQLRYNSYLVANVLVNQPLLSQPDQLLLMGEKGTIVRGKSTAYLKGVIVESKPKAGVVTLYRPLPYQEGQSEIFATGSYLKFRKEFIQQIEGEILPGLGIPPSAMVGLRIARWGHCLPLARKGFMSINDIETLHKPFQDRVFFVSQDNWLNPCLDVIFSESQRWCEALEKSVAARAKTKMEG